MAEQDHLQKVKQSGPLTEFTLFSKLPPELKHNIWDKSMPGRIIEIVYHEDDDSFYTQASNPVTLAVCKESRKQALFNYHLLEIKNLYSVLKRNEVQFKTYIDFKVDTIYLTESHLEGYMGAQPQNPLKVEGGDVYVFLMALAALTEVASNLRYIAFNTKSYQKNWVGIGLTAFSGLGEISLVYGDPCCERFVIGHRKALDLLDVGSRSGPCAHLHKRAEDQGKEIEDSIKAKLIMINRRPKHFIKQDPCLAKLPVKAKKDKEGNKHKDTWIDNRDKKKLVVVPKLIVRDW